MTRMRYDALQDQQKSRPREWRRKDGTLMTPEEVAELLRIDVAAVLRLAERDELPSFLFEDQRRFRRSELEAFLARPRAQPDAPSVSYSPLVFSSDDGKL